MTQRVGVRELREKLSLILESSETIEVTRHGQTIGFFIPIPNPYLTHQLTTAYVLNTTEIIFCYIMYTIASINRWLS